MSYMSLCVCKNPHSENQTMLVFQYPTWYLLFCALTGAAYAGILYYRDITFKEISPKLHYGLGVIRWLTASLLTFLLLTPLIRSLLTEVKKPVIVLAQDASESLSTVAKDSAKYQLGWDALEKALGDKYEIRKYAFGERVREGFDWHWKDKVTNISDLLKNVYDLYAEQNLGAVVLATDGIYNEGSNPIYTAAKLNVPIYTIALGDTTPQKDVVIKRIFHNNIAYLGDKFSVQIDLGATNCVGANLPVTLGKVDGAGNVTNLQTFNANVDKNNYFITKEVILDATPAGVQRYRVSVGQVAGEMTTTNNTKDFFVEILDARTKILLLGSAPHPDLGALSEVLKDNKNYTVTVAYLNDLKLNVSDFDFAILHQIPSVTNGAETILSALNTKRTPRLYIVGAQSDTRKLNNFQNMIVFNTDGKQTNDVQGVLNPNFNLFTLENAFKEAIQFNPLTAPFGEFKEAGNGQTLLYQRVGKVDTRYPLLTLGEVQGVKTGVLCAEGIWKWRLFDHLQHQNQNIFNGIVSKTVQYLSIKEDKRKFRISLEKNVFNENEPIQMVAELYNNSYELVNTPDATIVITDGQNKQYPYTFNKSGKSYTLNAGVLPAGSYTYKGTVTNNGETLTATGQFSVQTVQLELYETTANHALLKTLSTPLGGAMFSLDKMAIIADSIQHKMTVKPVLYQTTKTEPLIHLKWIFGLLAGLLALEWFLRRYFGGY
ncbi:MAG: hypothetical protein RLZZ628_3643 [Bacteroidota bacterium]